MAGVAENANTLAILIAAGESAYVIEADSWSSVRGPETAAVIGLLVPVMFDAAGAL